MSLKIDRIKKPWERDAVHRGLGNESHGGAKKRYGSMLPVYAVESNGKARAPRYACINKAYYVGQASTYRKGKKGKGGKEF